MPRRRTHRRNGAAETGASPGSLGHVEVARAALPEKKRRRSSEEWRRMRGEVEQLLRRHASRQQIERHMREEHDAGVEVTKYLIARVHAVWEADDQDLKARQRRVQLRSIEHDLQRIETELIEHEQAVLAARASNAVPTNARRAVPDFPIVLVREKRALLELQARLLGTEAPQESTVNLRAEVQLQQKTLVVVSQLTTEHVAAIVARRREERLLAAEARRLMGEEEEEGGEE